MTKSKNTKRALLASVLSMILCLAMLVGSTFAWFTDSVTSVKNRIVAGNLDVELVMDKQDGAGYVSIADGEGDIFTEAGIAQNSNATLWEPGKTQIVYLGVQNKGSLALKYNIILNVVDGGLIGSLEYAILDGKKAEDLINVTNWTDLKAMAGEQTGDMVAGKVTAAPNGRLDEIVNGEENETDYFALAVHMKEEADNRYMGKDVTIDVTVVATQADAESDSFDDQYDKDAASAQNMNAIKLVAQGYKPIKSLDDFEYESDGNAALISTDGKLFLNNDISKGLIWVFTSEDSITLDLNGYSYERGGYVTSDGADLTITDSVGTGKLQTVAADQGTVTLENCSITDRSNTMMVIYPGAKMIINGGHYNPMMITTQGEGAILIINDGVFELKDSRYIQTQTGGSIIVNGGTFKLNIANIAGVTLGEGKQCVDNGDGTWTVK